MNATKPCKDRFEDIVALVMGELDSPSTHELQEHLALCDRCRAARDVLTEEEKEVRSGFEALARRLGPVEQAALRQQQRQARVRVDVSSNHLLERVKTMILAHKRLSVAAAATAAALAATVIVYLSLLSSPTTAYALEQTVQANNHITSYHAKLPPPWSRMSEVWVQLKALLCGHESITRKQRTARRWSSFRKEGPLFGSRTRKCIAFHRRKRP
jgi:hypothetical protein